VNRQTTFLLSICGFVALAVLAREAQPALAAASVTLASGTYATRTTIPVTVDGQRASCILDTGSSAILVSPSLAAAAGLQGEGGTFELAPDGRTVMDRQTRIGSLAVAGYALHDVPALISSNLTGYSALCGYDFFMRFPSLIDRQRHAVTLFPTPAKLAHMHCLPVNLSPRVPLATVEINDTWLDGIVLDSGMVGGGVLWDGVRSRLRQPLLSNAGYLTNQPALRQGLSCGASASVRFAASTPANAMPICTEERRPDGYNGMIETTISSIHAMAVDYPHRRICFDVANAGQAWPASKSLGISRNAAWSRFDNLRPPTKR
jgi:hypothetical protein